MEKIMDDDGLKNQEIVMAYHERTKHDYHRFTMDWATL
jgi:hypothetical protein